MGSTKMQPQTQVVAYLEKLLKDKEEMTAGNRTAVKRTIQLLKGER